MLYANLAIALITMPRQIRYNLPGIPQHVIQRGNNRQAIFFAEEDYMRYLSDLKSACDQHQCEVHAYILMTNHVHQSYLSTNRHTLGRTL